MARTVVKIHNKNCPEVKVNQLTSIQITTHVHTGLTSVRKMKGFWRVEGEQREHTRRDQNTGNTGGNTCKYKYYHWRQIIESITRLLWYNQFWVSLSDHPNQIAQKQIYDHNLQSLSIIWFIFLFFWHASVMDWPLSPSDLMSRDGLTKLYFYGKMWSLRNIWWAPPYLTACSKYGMCIFFFFI